MRPVFIDRGAPFETGAAERRSGLFKEIYYKSRELLQPRTMHEAERLVHESAWALQAMTLGSHQPSECSASSPRWHLRRCPMVSSTS